jgi:hypothetical protein
LKPDALARHRTEPALLDVSLGVEQLVVVCLCAGALDRGAGRGDGDRDGEAAVVAEAGRGGAAVDRGEEATMVRPSPEPSWEVRSLSRWNGWKMRSASAGLMTGPVLATVSSLLPAALRVLIQMSP